jgi:2-methylisocitrate lyase-like PEP mutase family enzyme
VAIPSADWGLRIADLLEIGGFTEDWTAYCGFRDQSAIRNPQSQMKRVPAIEAGTLVIIARGLLNDCGGRK